MASIIRPIAEQTAMYFINNTNNRNALKHCIQEAKKIQSDLNKLNKDINTQQYLQSVYKVHMQNRQKQADAHISTAFNSFVKQHQETQETAMLQQWIDDLQKTAIEGYKVVMRTRKLVTKQDFIYRVRTGSGNKVPYSYTLTEDQYIELLSQEPLTTAWTSTRDLEKAAYALKTVRNKDVPLSSVFQLVTGRGSQVSIEDAIKKAPAPENAFKDIKVSVKHNLEKDAIYRYVHRAGNFIGQRKHPNVIDEARTYELYTMLLNRFSWQYRDGMLLEAKNNGTGFFSGKRLRQVRETIKNYKSKSELAYDNIAFYKTGDNVLNERTLIENKVGKAVVSISTITKAINDIAGLNNLNQKDLTNKLIEMFSHGAKGTTLEGKIYNGARDFAVKNIKEFITAKEI